MVKGISVFFAWMELLGGMVGCSTSQNTLDHSQSFPISKEQVMTQRLWTRPMPGVITDVNVAPDGKSVLVATLPNKDLESSGDEPTLTKLNAGGHQEWRLELSSPVRAQSLSGEGKFAVISSTDDQITGIGENGKELWSIEGTCRPWILNRAPRFLCYHDDDAESDIAFEILDWEGKKISSYPISSDILDLEVSEDERKSVIALTRGEVVLLGPEFRPVWKARVQGEISHTAVSGGSNPQVVVLYDSKKISGRQKLEKFNEKGSVAASIQPQFRIEKIAFSSDGKNLFAYGNAPTGQTVALYDADLREKWKRVGPRRADYSSNLIVAQDLAVVGFEDLRGHSRHNHILAFDLNGSVKWNLPLQLEEGAYNFSVGRELIAVGADDGTLSVYQICGQEGC